MYFFPKMDGKFLFDIKAQLVQDKQKFENSKSSKTVFWNQNTSVS